MNFNDARISRLYVTKTGGDVQNASPNAPVNGVGNPDPDFGLTLEMEAGAGVAGAYSLLVTAYDVSLGSNNNAMKPPTGPLNGPGTFATPPWIVAAGDRTFDQTVTISVPPNVREHVFHYTVALVSDNNQIVDIKESEPFILV